MGARGVLSSSLLGALALAAATPAVAQFSDGYSFLNAVKERDGAKAQTFLDKPGAPALGARNSEGDGALHIVVKRHDQTWLAYLISKGAQVDMRDRGGNTPLMIACQLSDVEAARLLLSVRADVNAANSRGETPLIAAVQHRDTPTIRLLILNGADPKKADTLAGKSALDYANEDSRGAAIVKILDEAKPKPKSAPIIAGPILG